MNDNYISVTELTSYIKRLIENDESLNYIMLKGEISNFKEHTSGHLYFSIKDENSVINAIMFKGSAMKLKFKPEDGMQVLLTGRISIYEARGSYQIYVTEMNVDGVGDLHIAFEQLKEKLEKEGLFSLEHKKQIPKLPNKIGVITASTGAAIRDILSTINRRFPLTEVILLPSLVQGDDAKENIVKQIRKAEELNFDVLIIGRGGGSIEDLWPFNEEIVARAIYESNIPIISGVGHENDYTIADFVADLRAPTPTGAAEMAVPDQNDIINYINNTNIRLYQSIKNIISTNKKLLTNLENSYIIKKPVTIYENKKIVIDNYYEKLINIIKNYFNVFKSNCNLLNEKLITLDPIATKFRGYAIASIDDTIISSIKKVKIGSNLTTSLKDGDIISEVKEIKEVTNGKS